MGKLYSAIIIFVIAITGSIFIAGHSKDYFSLHGDSMGYYIYLPSAFIYHNLRDIDKESPGKKTDETILLYATNTKNARAHLAEPHLVVQYTYGIALMELPFFLAAHGYELSAGLPADGYSNSYLAAIFLSGLFYLCLGLFLTYKILREYFPHIHSLLAIALLLLGTNMFWFGFAHIGMSHIPLFFLYTLLLYLSQQLHKYKTGRYIVAIGFVAGLITVIRPTDVICLLIPLCYGLNSKEMARQKIAIIKDHLPAIALAVVAFVIPVIPQLLYWKMLTGNYLYYSYADQGFNWSNPKIIEGLFYFSNGWLPYAPIMILALAGLVWYKTFKPWAPVILVLMPLYIYIIYSWYCYNYINGLGSRPMLHVYSLMAFPLAAFIHRIAAAKLPVKALVAVFCLVSIAAMYSFSALMTQFKFRSESANFQFYSQMLFSNRLTYDKLVSWDLSEFQPDEEKLVNIKTLASNNFNQPTGDHYVADPEQKSGYIAQIWEGEEYFPDGIRLPCNPKELEGAKWIKCSGRFMYTEYGGGAPRMMVFSVSDKDNNNKVWKGCHIDNKIGISDSSCKHDDKDLDLHHVEYWHWGEIHFFTKIPVGLTNTDVIKLEVWNIPKKTLFFDDFKIELYR